MKPRARTEGLVVTELPDELLVYDLERHRAYCLNPTAALVFKHYLRAGVHFVRDRLPLFGLHAPGEPPFPAGRDVAV